jgi:hypothetical protein
MQSILTIGLREAASSLGLSHWVLRKYVKQGKIRAVRIGPQTAPRAIRASAIGGSGSGGRAMTPGANQTLSVLLEDLSSADFSYQSASLAKSIPSRSSLCWAAVAKTARNLLLLSSCGLNCSVVI